MFFSPTILVFTCIFRMCVLRRVVRFLVVLSVMRFFLVPVFFSLFQHVKS